MVQQINLLNPALIRQKEYLTAPIMAMVLGVAVLAMLAMYGFEQYQLRPLAQESKNTTQVLQALQVQFNAVSVVYAQRDTNKLLQNEIIETERKLQLYQQVLKKLGVTPTGNSQGFSAYMRAFARQHLEGVWLTGFEINDVNAEMMIRGKALQPNLVPQYISKLGLDPAFKGRAFATLNMSAQKIGPKSDVIASQSSTVQAAALPVALEPLPPYVEFTLQSSSNEDKAMPVTAGAKS